MKRLLTSLLCAAFAVSASAALLPAGTQELGLSGGVDFDTAAGTQIDLDIFYGFFVEDSLQLGAKIGLYNDDDVTAWTIGPTPSSTPRSSSTSSRARPAGSGSTE